MSSELKQFLNGFRTYLRLDPLAERQIIRELYTHLEEKVEELKKIGLPEEEALKEATKRLGRPKALAREMYEVHSAGSWGGALLAAAPHMVMSALFLSHLWDNLFWVGFAFLGFAGVTIFGWRHGKPTWFYPWLGYSLILPLAGCLFCIFLLARGLLLLVSGGGLGVSWWVWPVILVYLPFSLWLLAFVAVRIIRRDWLLGSLTVLPLSILISWLMTLQNGFRLADYNRYRIHDADPGIAVMFLVLALAVAFFIRLRQRVLKIGAIIIAAPLLLIMVPPQIGGSPGFFSFMILSFLSIALLLSPALLELKLGHGEGEGWSEVSLEHAPGKS